MDPVRPQTRALGRRRAGEEEVVGLQQPLEGSRTQTFSLLYVAEEAMATFLALYATHRIAPACIVHRTTWGENDVIENFKRLLRSGSALEPRFLLTDFEPRGLPNFAGRFFVELDADRDVGRRNQLRIWPRRGDELFRGEPPEA
jgi:hypothetical protein